MFSSYSDGHPVSLKNCFCLDTGKRSTDYTTASSVPGLGCSPALSSLVRTLALCEEYGDGMPVRHYAKLLVPPVAWVYYAKGISTGLIKQARGLDPPFQCIGIGSDLRNWMPDTGTSSHFTLCLLDL